MVEEGGGGERALSGISSDTVFGCFTYFECYQEALTTGSTAATGGGGEGSGPSVKMNSAFSDILEGRDKKNRTLESEAENLIKAMQFGCQRVHASRTVGLIKADIATDRPPFLEDILFIYLGASDSLGRTKARKIKLEYIYVYFIKELIA